MSLIVLNEHKIVYSIDVFLHAVSYIQINESQIFTLAKDVKRMVLSSLFSGGTSSSSIVGQVEFLILLLIVTLIVALLGQGLTLRVVLPRWKDKLVRAEVEMPLTTET
jgi:hypothetical protein